MQGWGENDRGVSFTFGADVVSKFLHRHDLDLICRAHQVNVSLNVTLYMCYYIYIWVLASTLAHSASEINKAPSVTYTLLFILSKNIVSSRSYRYIRDRAFPVTRLPPPIYTKFDVSKELGAGKRPGLFCNGTKWKPFLLPISLNWFFWQSNNFLYLARCQNSAFKYFSIRFFALYVYIYLLGDEIKKMGFKKVDFWPKLSWWPTVNRPGRTDPTFPTFTTF